MPYTTVTLADLKIVDWLARIAAATKEAEAAEARQAHAQELLNRLQASIAAIKLEGAGV